eukprot:474167_1
MVCDGKQDCFYNDDENSCTVCIEIYDNNASDTENVSYLAAQFEHIGYDTQNKGIIYYNEPDLLLYPSIYNDGAAYYYFYDIISVHNHNNVLAYCYMFNSSVSIPYLLSKIVWCNENAHFYAYSQSGKEKSIAMKMNYCESTIGNKTLNVSILINESNFKIPIWIDAENTNTSVFYVAATGNDVNNCGTIDLPCGTLKYVTSYAKFVAQNIESIRSITIIIRGQNKKIIMYSNQFYSENLCFPDLDFSNNYKVPYDSITFTFDPYYIKTKEDRFPTLPLHQFDLLCNQQRSDAFFYVKGHEHSTKLNFTVTINNLIINDWNVIDSTSKTSYIAGFFCSRLSKGNTV